MKQCIVLFVGLLVGAASVNAQDDYGEKKSVLAVGLGASANYYYGPGDQNIGNFTNERLNWSVNGMLGFVIGHDDAGRRSILGGFGNLGFNKAGTVSQMLKDQGYLTNAANQDNTNNAFQVEGGLMILDVLRVSTGIGQQNFATQNLLSTTNVKLNQKSLKYNSSTVGVNLKFSLISISVNCNFNYGKDYNKTVLNPYAGLMLHL
jgi:hypothetical protein